MLQGQEVSQTSTSNATDAPATTERDPKRALRGKDFDEQEKMLAPPDDDEPRSTRDPKVIDPVRIDVLKRDLKQELDDNDMVAKQLWPAVDVIKEKLKTASGDEKADLEVTLKDLEGKQKAADGKVEAARGDLELLDKGPAVTQAQLNDMLARRGTTVPQGTTTDVQSSTTVGEDGSVNWAGGTTTNTMTEDGASKTTADKTTTNIGLTSGSHERSNETKEVKGDQVTTKGTSDKTAYDLKNGSITQSHTDSSRVGKNGTSTTNATEVGVGGVKQSTSTTVSKGDDKTTSSTSTGLTRGGGKLGVASTTSNKVENKDGSGSSSSTTTSGGIIAGKDGVGAYGNGETSGSKKYANGLAVTGKAAAGGKVVYNIEEVPDTKPTKYLIKGTVSLDASLEGGLSGEKEHKDKQGEKLGNSVSGGGSVSASAAIQMSFGVTLDEAGVTAWKEQLALAEKGGGGSSREMQIISAGVSQGWPAARALYDRMQAGGGITDSLADGESVGLSVDGKLGAKVDAGGKSGGTSVGIGGGAEVGRKFEGEVAREGDATTTDLRVTDSSSYEGKGTAGFGVASMSLGGKKSSSEGSGFKFKIPDSNPNAAALRAEAEGLRTQEDIAAFAKAHPELIAAKTNTKGEGTDVTTGMAVGPAGAEMTSGGSTSSEHTEKYDDKGGLKSKTDKEVGESHLGGKANLGPLSMSSNSKEQVASTVTTEVDADGKQKQTATGDVSKTDSESSIDAAGTLKNLANVGSDPLGTLTGKKPIVAQQDKTEVAGFFLSDDDFNDIMAKAKTPEKWQKAFSRVANIDKWEECRKEIKAAGSDKAAVAKALAKFGGSGEHGGNTNLEELLGVQQGKGGDRYEFPDGVGDLKKPYLELVVNSPMGEIDKLVSENKLAEAAQTAQALADKVGELETKFGSKAGEYQNANVFGEMTTRISTRHSELTMKSRELGAKASGKALSPEELERETADNEFKRLMGVCKQLCEQEARLFGTIGQAHTSLMGNHSEAENVKMVNELRANVKLWEPQYEKMIALADQWGFTGGGANFRDWKPDQVKLKFAYEGKNPLSEEAKEAQSESDQKDKLAAETNAEIAKSSSAQMAVTAGMTRRADGSYYREYTKEEKAANDKKAYEDLRPRVDADFASRQGKIEAARATCTQAKGKCNRLTSAGNWDAVSKAAFAPYNQGYALSSQAERSWKAALAAQKATNMSGLKLYFGNAQHALSELQEATEAFKKGDALQG